MKDLKEIIKNIPHLPGCYKYFDIGGELIYIGKAKDLRKRVSSYFNKKDLDPKTHVLVENIANIKWEVTDSEIEALVLESLLIKKYRPRFNIKIKDDKDFLWLKIDMSQDFPFPELVRRQDFQGGRKIKLFGPFTDSRLLKRGLVVLRKIFLWRDCSASKFSFYQKKGKPCLEYYIKNCSAPCVLDNNHSQLDIINKNDYQLGIKQLISFMEGKKKGLVKNFEKEMRKFSKKKDFEKAALFRDKVRALQHMDAGLKMDKVKKEKAKDMNNFIKLIDSDLDYNLKQKNNFRIEFYDISNTSGKEATGSMVVWEGDGFNKNSYRKFKIKFVKGPNDAEMMREVLSRRARYFNSQKPNSKFKDPDMIVLDGGKPQLGGVYKLFQQLKIGIPLISLAKRDEEVWGIKSGNFKKTSIKKDSPEGFFIQRLRDEAHRFAIGYHKVLREKKIIKSRLDEIEGIGPVTKKKLLLSFGSVEGIIKASLEDVMNIVGDKLARRIKGSL